MTTITVHDGATSIGGKKIHVEEGGRGVFLDFGKNFAKSGAFFSEFLKERPGRGLNDAFFLDLVPKLNIYRKDLGTTAHPVPLRGCVSHPICLLWLQVKLKTDCLMNLMHQCNIANLTDLFFQPALVKSPDLVAQCD